MLEQFLIGRCERVRGTPIWNNGHTMESAVWYFGELRFWFLVNFNSVRTNGSPVIAFRYFNFDAKQHDGLQIRFTPSGLSRFLTFGRRFVQCIALVILQ